MFENFWEGLLSLVTSHDACCKSYMDEPFENGGWLIPNEEELFDKGGFCFCFGGDLDLNEGGLSGLGWVLGLVGCFCIFLLLENNDDRTDIFRLFYCIHRWHTAA